MAKVVSTIIKALMLSGRNWAAEIGQETWQIRDDEFIELNKKIPWQQCQGLNVLNLSRSQAFKVYTCH